MFGGFFDLPSKQSQLKDLEARIEADSEFWNDPKTSAAILQEKKSIESLLQKIEKLSQLESDITAALELGTEEEFREEAERSLKSLELEIKALEIASLLKEQTDRTSALLTINAGAGGTESCDWASMILRMYLRYCEKKSWNTEIHDMQEGEEAGIKSATIEIQGEYAFGLLKAEIGVHRLVRISPFDSNAKRHTSFASVFVSPIIDDEIEIIINPSDLRIDTYRASGSGGQHVNRTDSAVRITHLPTNTVVQCQSQRSQHQNKDTAMKMLKSKLYERELEERRKKQDALESSKSDIGFGSQIRSYVLHPYKMVKDHRTELVHQIPQDILDGELDAFIYELLTQK